MGSYVWKGVTSKYRYEFIQAAIPSALLDVTGQPLLIGTYNGEVCVNANHDGSVALAVATGPPYGASAIPTPGGGSGNDIYSAYTLKSLWEQQAGATTLTTPTRVQAFGGSGISSATASATVTAENSLLVVCSSVLPQGIPSDTLGNEWAQMVIPDGPDYATAWTTYLATGGSDTISFASPGGTCALAILEVTGADPFAVGTAFAANFGRSPAYNTGATPAPIGKGLAVGLLAYAAPNSFTRIFTPALTQADETVQEYSNGVQAAISSGPTTTAETFSGALPFPTGPWTAWCVLIQGHS